MFDRRPTEVKVMAGPPSNRELLAHLRSWIAENYPGTCLDHIEIYLLFMGKPLHPISLSDSPLTPADRVSQDTPVEIAAVEPADERKKLPDPLRDILKVMREIKKPLTVIRMMEEMQKRGMEEWSDRTLNRYLALLMEDGMVINPHDAKRPGYRLAELETE
jgi:hypothetical protein